MAINKSLSALGDVISSLQRRTAHVPYRNSKLTAVLQDSLCGSSKVLLVCNLSPESASTQETLSSLNFASRAAQVELGQVKRVAAEKQPAAITTGGGSEGGAGGSGGGTAPAGATTTRESGGGADSRASSPGSSPVRPSTAGGAARGSRLSERAAGGGGGGSPSASAGGSPRLPPGVFAKPARH